MKKDVNNHKDESDDYEEEILTSYDNNEWLPIENVMEEMESARSTTQNTTKPQ